MCFFNKYLRLLQSQGPQPKIRQKRNAAAAPSMTTDGCVKSIGQTIGIINSLYVIGGAHSL